MEQSYNPNPNPQSGGLNTAGPPPKNWLVESILVTIFCCLPFGIVAIINAAAVNTKLGAGDYAGAAESSANAGKWVKYSIIAWAVLGVVWVFLVMVMGVGAGMLGALQGND